MLQQQSQNGSFNKNDSLPKMEITPLYSKELHHLSLSHTMYSIVESPAYNVQSKLQQNQLSHAGDKYTFPVHIHPHRDFCKMLLFSLL